MKDITNPLHILTLITLLGLLATPNGFIRNIYDETKSFWISKRCLNGSRPIRKCCKRIPFWTRVFLPNPSDCRSYFRCNMLKMDLLPCPYNYHWSKSQQKCLKPRLAECKDQDVTKKSTTSTPNSTQPESEEMMPRTEKPVSTTKEPIPTTEKPSKTKKPTSGSSKTTKEKVSSQSTTSSSITTGKTSKKHPKTTVATTTPFSKSKDCQEGREDPFECCKKVPYWENFMMSYPVHKNIYIECDHEQPVLKQCRKGLEWSTTANRCSPHKKTKKNYCN